MEVAEYYSTYAQQLEDYFERFLRQTKESLTPVNQQMVDDSPNDIQTPANEIFATVEAKGPVDTPRHMLVEIYAWASITTAGSMVGTCLGYTLLAPLMPYLVDVESAAIISYLVLPLTAQLIFQKYGYIQSLSHKSNVNLRFLSLGFCMVQGVFNGHVIHNIYVTGQPPAFLTPAIIAYSFANMPQEVGNNRIAQLSSSLSCALAGNISVGAITGYLTSSYFLLSLIYCAIAGIVMQFIFKRVHQERPLHTFQHALTSLMIIAKGLFFLIFGSYACVLVSISLNEY
ncbi:unnamed protein product [Strongylus vulgaris]|uniref:Uncharacterized protein n=1 Tax=Strongylus vulgaris TaxID=40348 RepID=A0A3P7IVD4_STRVU|nr:unnamed protein product [Strongylus vulgaris]